MLLAIVLLAPSASHHPVGAGRQPWGGERPFPGSHPLRGAGAGSADTNCGTTP